MQNVTKTAQPWNDIPGSPLPTTDINADPMRRNVVPPPAHLDKQKWQYGDTVIWFDGDAIHCQKKGALDGELPKANAPWMKRVECGNSRFIQLIAVFGYEKEVVDDDQEISQDSTSDSGIRDNIGQDRDGGAASIASRIRRYRTDHQR